MPLYEFECPSGHVTEAIVSVGTAHVACGQCPPVIAIGRNGPVAVGTVMAHRILSPTRTTFHFADRPRAERKFVKSLQKE
jgi:hypothetical protein